MPCFTDYTLATFTGLFCLVSGIEEDTHSVIPLDRIVSPSKDDLTVGCMCKVKKFEKCLSQIKAVGKFDKQMHTPTFIML